MRARWLGGLAALAVTLAVASCYIPDNFRAELRLSRYGDFELDYQGDLVYVPILHDYAEGNVKPSEDAARQESIHQDLIRDTAFTQVQAMGKGRFRVNYAGPVKVRGTKGLRLGRDELVAIVRRDARLLALKAHPDGQIVMAANAIKPADAETMARLGVTMKGEFRVTTDAHVVQNNATEVRTFGQYTVYIWRIENALSPMPRLVMIRDTDPERPLP
jgi:hypothetical protein